jgi:hypothetical protein
MVKRVVSSVIAAAMAASFPSGLVSSAAEEQKILPVFPDYIESDFNGVVTLTLRDAEENISASARALGAWRFACLAGIITIVFCLVFFALEAFSFFHWLYWLQCAGASALLTFMLIMVVEGVRK